MDEQERKKFSPFFMTPSHFLKIDQTILNCRQDMHQKGCVLFVQLIIFGFINSCR